jgi:hypothetical protein
LREADAPFWKELTAVNERHLRPKVVDHVAEDLNNVESDCEIENLNDSDISLRNVLEATHQEQPLAQHRGQISESDKGGLTTISAVERLEELPAPEIEGNMNEVDGVEHGRGKRRKTTNRLYSLADFAPHWDNEASDVD